MSSWYVWSAILGYPETPGSETVAIGSPLFTAVSIQLADGKSITESAPAAASDAPYIHHLKLDQKAWHRAYLPPSIFSDGASLDWTLSTKPDTSWGAGAADAPPSDTQGLLPALGYLGEVNGDVMVASGGTATVALGAQSLSVDSQQIGWTASAESGSGIQVLPAGGTIAVEPESRATVPVAIHVASSTATGQYMVRFALRTQAGTMLPDVVVELDVT